MRKCQAAQAETNDRDERFGPTVRLGRILGRGASETEEDSVSGLHGDEGAEGVIDGTIDQSGDEAAPEEEDVSVCGADFGCQIPLTAVEESLGSTGALRLF